LSYNLPSFLSPFRSSLFSSSDSGDVFVEVNHKPVRNIRDILDSIGLDVGKTIEFKIQRDNRDMMVSLTTAPEKQK
jgi:S1-C subfamily serine protease